MRNWVLAAPAAPTPHDVTVHTGFLASVQAWFTPQHVGGALALLLIVLFIRSTWKMLASHPVLLVIVVVVALVAVGFATITLPHDSGHQPLVPPEGR